MLQGFEKLGYSFDCCCFLYCHTSLVSIIIIIIIIIIILVVTLIQSIYNYRGIPETNHVARVHSVAAVLYLQCVLHVMLFRP